jgi:hypothetical protein
MKSRTLAAPMTLMLGLACLGSAAARADVTYTYTGNPFTSVTRPYTLTDSITGSFVLSQPLADNLAETEIFPLSFSFYDGQEVLSNTTSETTSVFDVATNAAGTIDAWDISMRQASSGIGINTTDDMTGTNDSVTAQGIIVLTLASNVDDPGTWMVAPTVVPEPPPVALLGSGLLGLVFLCRRRKPLRLAQ